MSLQTRSTALATPFNGAAERIALTRESGQERQLLQLLASQNPAERAVAIQLFNKFSQKVTQRLLQLSSAANFPDTQTAGIPSALVLGDNERQRVDTRWAALFDFQDLRQQEHPYFKLVDLYHAITFKAYQLGERIEMGFVEAAQNIFEMEVIAGGLQWNQLWSEWQNVWNTQQGLAAMQAKYLVKQAQTGYEVITAAGIQTTAYQGAADAPQLVRDIMTINQTIVDIETDIYTDTAPKGGQQTEEEVVGATYYLLYNAGTAGYEDRVARALTARVELPNADGAVGQVRRPVVPVGTRRVPTGGLYLVLPGRKLVAAVGRDLRIYDVNDARIAGVAEGRVGQGAYKLVRGDSRQVRKAALS